MQMSTAQVKIIFDTDFGGDADDLGALAMLHHFVDKGECDLLAVMSWSTEKYAVPAIDAVNRYYGHPNTPIGVRKGEVTTIDWNYSKPIADMHPHNMTYDVAPDAVSLYRQLLSLSEDESIVIVTVGPLKNIENLLKSQPDSLSELDGKELVKQKVKEFVIMGGRYPSGSNEWNFDGGMKGVTKFVIENIEVPVTFSGYELGVTVKTGEVFNSLDPSTPLYTGFYHFSKYAPWMKEYYKGKILDNSTYDQTAVLYAVRGGIGEYWENVPGTCVPDETGGNDWLNKTNGAHNYLELIIEPEQMALLIENMMLGKF